jgi:hypothetical protein
MFPAIFAAAWLFVSDIHLDPADRSPLPARAGSDTNRVLLQSTIDAMRRVEPHPPVVVLGGDFLGHQRFDLARSTAVMRELARRFDAAFPDAQFVLTLGNDDSACGDYAIAPDGPFLHAVAKAWEPLVNRRGAAPHFAQTFAHDGFYSASLPVAGLRAVVVDDVFWSPLFRHCGGPNVAAAQTFAELSAELRRGRTARSWILLHIPPGVDVSSTTSLVHRFAVVPFLDPGPRAALVAVAGNPANRVELVIAGHAHRFGFRVLPGEGEGDGVPLLMVPAVSPIYRTNPAFLRVEVGADGTVGNVTEYARSRGGWSALGGLDELGVTRFRAPALRALTSRLGRDPAARVKFATLYGGGVQLEITAGNQRNYWCAITELAATSYRRCLGAGGFSFLTGRGVAALAASLAAVLVLAAVIVVRVARRRRYEA